jgi:aryl-alcohol dehydrogenase-like predicted oxidoreductase
MQYRSMGNSGLRVSEVGLGTNQFGGKVDQRGVNDIIDAALDHGVNLIDTADVYRSGRSEETLGKALKGRWDRVVLATKVYGNTGDGPNDHGASRYHMMEAVEASLRRLQTDHIDLYQIHRWDEETPIEETLRTLDDLVAAGKVRYIGASNFAAWQLARANTLAEFKGWTPFVTIQNHYHMLERGIEDEVLPYCRAFNVGILPYFPLAGGFLTGKYEQGTPAPAGSRGEDNSYVQSYMTDENYTIVEKLTAWAEDRGRTMAQLAHAWLLSRPQVCSVISGATKVSQVEENVRSAEWDLSEEALSQVNGVLEGEA